MVTNTTFHALTYLFMVQQRMHFSKDGSHRERPANGSDYPDSWVDRRLGPLTTERAVKWFTKPVTPKALQDVRFSRCLFHPETEVNQRGEGDHVHPRAKGGWETAWYLCPSCNSSKGSRNFFEWMAVKSYPVPQHFSLHQMRGGQAPQVVCAEYAFAELLWLALKLEYRYRALDGVLNDRAPQYFHSLAAQMRRSYLPGANWSLLSDIVCSVSAPNEEMEVCA